MQIRRCLTLAALAATSSTALAHPGHADPGIHVAEWLIGLMVLVGAGLVVRSVRKHFTHHGRDRADMQQS